MIEINENKIKYLSLIVLVIQNSILIIILKYYKENNNNNYIVSTSIMVNEILKFIISELILYFITNSNKKFLDINIELFRFKNIKMLIIPSILYLIQNNIIYIAISNLNIIIFQIVYQFKIITTVIFSIFILNKKISNKQWIYIILLTLGIIIVIVSEDINNKQIEKSNILGYVSVIIASITSGLNGVYFEKIIKTYEINIENNNKKYKIWINNIQLSALSMIFCIFIIYFQDGKKIAQEGFFQNYIILTWIIIFIQAIGGLIVSIVIKYTDNIFKSFAISISIIISSIISIIFFNFIITYLFIIGTFFVLLATKGYNS